MDRFIESMRKLGLKDAFYLKSNMDRFIAPSSTATVSNLLRFKIQYGQIYSKYDVKIERAYRDLKSNMDRFIVKQQKTA